MQDQVSVLILDISKIQNILLKSNVLKKGEEILKIEPIYDGIEVTIKEAE